MKRNKLLFLIFFGAGSLTVGTLSGCSGIRTYPDNLPKNVVIRTKTGSRIKAYVDIRAINSACKYDYMGTLKLENGRSTVGVPTGTLISMEFRFTYSTLLGGSTSTFSYDVVFRPKRQHEYRVYASYVDDIYDIRISENASGERHWQRLKSTLPHGCHT